MAYDPKKKRPKSKSLDSVVDEIFGEEESALKTNKTPKKSKSTKTNDKTNVTSIDKKAKSTKSTGKPKAKKASQAKKEAKIPAKDKDKDKAKDKAKDEANAEDKSDLDNVLPLRPNAETPLVMQPQVWVATGIAALIVLLLARKRKNR